MKKTTRITAWTVALVLAGTGAMTLHAEESLAAGSKDGKYPCYHKQHFHHKGPHSRRLAPPLIKALDSDGDGLISSSEIANASSSLAKLDKNGDGNLTRDEVRPRRWKRNCQNGAPERNRPNDADTSSKREENTPEEMVEETPAE